MTVKTDKQPLPFISIEDEKWELAQKFDMELCQNFKTPEAFDKVPYSFVRKNLILPLHEADGKVVAAVSDPLNLHAVDELRLILNIPVEAVYCPEEQLLLKIEETYQRGGEEASDFLGDFSGRENLAKEGEYDLLDEREDAPVIRFLNMILSEAIQQGASDIHFEPLENDLRVRYRIDGVLQTRHLPTREHQNQLLTRLKVMARLDIAEHRLPQDGRIKLKLGGREIDFRVSTVPVNGGERIVLRILDKGNIVLGLDKLGMPQSLLTQLRKLISLPEGILLVTGPTGSGKTTTLYSALSELSDDEVNIMTTEDPVEYKIQGIAQIGVRPKIGLTFASSLRHILRQDPDVIMVGEVRDTETAEIAIQASLTGHMVLSTLHTNDAPSALTRLVDMGIEPYLLSSSMVGVLAQRLVRTICPNCKESYSPSEAELSELNLQEELLYRGRGCNQCFGTGYKGRRGLYELMVIDNQIRSQVVQSADAVALRRLAIQEGMETLAKHGRELVAQGETTIAEVLRVTRGIEEV